MLTMSGPKLTGSTILSLGVVGSLCLSLGACGGSGAGVGSASDQVQAEAKESQHSQNVVEEAIALLHKGKPEAARKRLLSVLQRHPDYAVATKLLREIDIDPKLLLGASSNPYTVGAGETFSSIAQRYLGDPLMFFALARYNGMQKPDGLVAGQSILIPVGERATRKPVASKRSHPAPLPSREPRPPKAVPKARALPSPDSTAAKPAARPSDPTLAAKLRGLALTAMNNGAINRAIALLRRALSVDPSNAVVKADLSRAIRIRGALGR